MREGRKLKYDCMNLQYRLGELFIDDPKLTQLKIVHAIRQLSGWRYYELTELGQTIII
jgi:hypothetical protein